MELCRWQRAQSWQPCAIGGSPSTHDPNGSCTPVWLPAVGDAQQPAGQQSAGAPLEGDSSSQQDAGEETNFFARFGEALQEPMVSDEALGVGRLPGPPSGVAIAPADIAVW